MLHQLKIIILLYTQSYIEGRKPSPLVMWSIPGALSNSLAAISPSSAQSCKSFCKTLKSGDSQGLDFRNPLSHRIRYCYSFPLLSYRLVLCLLLSIALDILWLSTCLFNVVGSGKADRHPTRHLCLTQGQGFWQLTLFYCSLLKVRVNSHKRGLE